MVDSWIDVLAKRLGKTLSGVFEIITTGMDRGIKGDLWIKENDLGRKMFTEYLVSAIHCCLLES